MDKSKYYWLIGLLALSLISVLTFTNVIHAQESEEDRIIREKKEKMHPKVEGKLWELQEEYVNKGPAAAYEFARKKILKIEEGDKITVFLVLEKDRTLDTINTKQLQAYGVELINSVDNLIEARIPIPLITQIADHVEGISFIQLPEKPKPLSYLSEGVSLADATPYHWAGYIGQGIKVAIIDLGFAGLSSAISNGDLPSNMVLVDCTGTGCASTTFPSETEPHGTAVAEIIYDMAHGAQLYLIKIANKSHLVNAKSYCVSNGIKVINHSIGWVNQNFYDGTCYNNNPVCTAEDAYDNGILWVNSAGNEAQMHYDATFTDSDTDGWHEISGSDETINISANEDETIALYMTWNAWPTTDQDYDLYLYDSSMNQVDSSLDPQTGTQSPTEAISYSVPNAGTYYLKIKKYNASSNHQLEVYSFNHQLDPAVSSSSLMNPADAAGVMAVAAIHHESWTTGDQEPFSSQGPTNDDRTKPEISGPDGVSNYTYGSFYGTSAASPHVAGAAALILSKNSGYSVSQLWNTLTGSAIDMGASGQDNIYGYGRLNLPELCPDNFSASNSNFSLQYAKSLKGGIREAYGKLPLYFVRNNGQMDERVRFYEKGIGHATFFTEEGVFVSLGTVKKPDVRDKKPEGLERKADLITLTPLHANKNPVVVAEGEQESRINYFLGNDPNKWKTHIPTYKGVLYKGVYEGIDIRYYGNNQQLEYDIIVKPGADPGVVKFSYEGIEDLRVTEEGDLEMALEKGNIVQKRPYVYQDIEGKRVEIDGRFVVLDDELSLTEGSEKIDMNKKQGRHFSYAFEIAAYDTKHPLIIDPTLVYSTYLGGSDMEWGYDIATDVSGNAYITGGTVSSDFPLDSPIQGTCASCNAYPDVFVTKINATGDALLYSTYLGGDSDDWGYGIAVDTSGNVHITGYTSSSDFPVTSPIQGTLSGPFDAFVTKINASGSAISYSTYLGGDSMDNGEDIAVDAYGNAYITGPTYSSDFPLSSPIQEVIGGEHDAFVTKINNSGNAFIYSTYLGGSDPDYGISIAVDTYGDAYVTGVTTSSDFPISTLLQGSFGGSYDAFVTKINNSGNALLYSTYLGGSDVDYGYGIAVDTSGNAYIAGETVSSDFPVVSPIQATCASCDDEYPDAFVAKIDALGNDLLYSTYLGGSDEDYAKGIAADIEGVAYITGLTSSSDFPVASPNQGTLGGASDAFVTKTDTSGSTLLYSTYLGGTEGEYGSGIAVDVCKNIYITGTTGSSDFPLDSPIQGTLNGSADAFITKIEGGL